VYLVSGTIWEEKITTPGDYAHVLIAMNPAAVKANAKFMNPGGTIIYDVDAFTEKNLQKALFKTNDPFAECNLDDYFKIPVPITSLTKESLKEFELDNKSVLRSKNMFALGLVCWMFDRSLDYIESFINKICEKTAGRCIEPESSARWLQLRDEHAAHDPSVYCAPCANRKRNLSQY
jgi:2-oxoglutarate ferredoxin oxidoreductase subunit alpha